MTDSITYALTIGKSLRNIRIDANSQPVCIHLLHPPGELFEDLCFLIQSNFTNVEHATTARCLETIEQSDIDRSIKKRFHELTNMFQHNKGIEVVFISTATLLDKISSIDWSKLLNKPFMKTSMNKSLPLNNNKEIYISAWQGSYTNYIRYACQIEGYSLPDLTVSFHPSFTSSPQKLINDWTDDLKIILNNNFPCLLTFSDDVEKEKAYKVLNAFQSNFVSIESNQFSSLMLKQIPSKPNHVFAANSFSMIIDGFASAQTESAYSIQQTNGKF